MLFQDLITFLFYEIPEYSVFLLVCLPRIICGCDGLFDFWVLLAIDLMKNVTGGTRQGNTGDQIEAEHLGPCFVLQKVKCVPAIGLSVPQIVA